MQLTDRPQLWNVDASGEERKVTYLATLQKHTQAVNVVRWCPRGMPQSRLFASSCTDYNRRNARDRRRRRQRPSLGTLRKPSTQFDVWRRRAGRRGNMEGQDNVQVEQRLRNIRPGMVTGRNVLHHWKHGQCCEDIQCYKRYAEAADSSADGYS
jgi:hypothetical protein